jgi:NADH dehydrogenase
MTAVSETHRVVIVGGGFGGMLAARALGRQPVDVTVIDRRNFHLFQPLLYQVATGGLSPANIASPLRSILRRQRNTRVVLAEVTGFDAAVKQVLLADGTGIPFDSLILAAGSGTSYFGHDEWAACAPPLKSVEDATEIRRRVLTAFEKAERTADPVERARLLTFVVVGGGPTGMELAGAIRELALYTLPSDFRAIDTRTARVVLVEGHTRLIAGFHETLSLKAKQALEKMGVEVHLESQVADIQPDHVLIKPADGKTAPYRIETATVLWAAGVSANPLGRKLAEAAGGEVDRGGRVVVNSDCSIGNRPDLFVIGDLANLKGADGKPLPGLAPVAMQQGTYVADAILRRVRGEAPRGPFQYWDKGTMATIGRNQAVAETHGLRFSGYLAWLAWLFIHILYLTRFENRILVMFQWFWNYVTRNRAARLITWTKPPDR